MSQHVMRYIHSTRRTPLLVLLLVGGIACFGVIGFGIRASGDELDVDRRISAHLSAGEFGPARQVVDQLNDAGRRDAWLRGIAEAQMQTGSRYASLATAFDIQDGQSRGQAMGDLAGHPILGGPRGGAALADFDSLIELITATIAPDSWDEVGGPGAIEEFPGGVFVDGSGLLRRVDGKGADPTLSALRRSSSSSASGNRHVRRKSPLRKVSLTRLERHVQMQWALGRRPDEAMTQLAGLQEIKYLLFYPESGDIVIAGPAGDWKPNPEGRAVSADTGRPVLQLDDLVVVLRNSFDGDGRFGCSINPVKENIASVQAFSRASAKSPLKPSERDAWLKGLRDRLGKQEISVFGIDPRTRAARTLVEADYHMKLVGMGLQPGTPGVTSYLDSIKLAEGGTPPMDVLRWWFTLNFDHVKTTKARDAFQLHGPGVRVLSENELLTERGERVHTGASDEVNQQFAHSFTAHFDALAAKYPVYAELRNVFNLASVAAIIRSEDLANRIGWEAVHWRQPERFQVELGVAPRQVESVINHRLIDRKHIVVGVSGGVSVDANHFVSTKSFKVDDYGLMQSSRSSSTPKQPPRDAWWWD